MNAETQFHVSVMNARLKKVKKQRDEYKKQRDELINDMAEVKRKAKAFDKLVEFYPQKDEIPSDEFFDEMGYIIKERADHER